MNKVKVDDATTEYACKS